MIWIWDEIVVVSRRFAGQAQPVKVLMALAMAIVISYGLLATLPEQAGRYRDWNGVLRDDLKVLQAAELDNALVFVPRPNWQFYAPIFLENSTTLDGNVIYAVDRGDERNPVLMRDFPGRRFYLYRDGELIPLDETGASTKRIP